MKPVVVCHRPDKRALSAHILHSMDVGITHPENVSKEREVPAVTRLKYCKALSCSPIWKDSHIE